MVNKDCKCKNCECKEQEAFDKTFEDSIPYTNRIKKINDLYRSGHTIIYWTARGTSTGIDWELLTKRQLFDWGVMYHEVRLGKPSYDVWIDDKAFNDKHFFGET